MKLTLQKKKQLRQIAEKHKLKLILLFGSFATGKNRPDSDIDIAILGQKNPSFEEILNLSAQMSGIFEKNVDLSVINQANPLLLFEISKNAILLHGEKMDFFKFRLRAFHRYNDYRPFFKMEAKTNEKIIQNYVTQ